MPPSITTITPSVSNSFMEIRKKAVGEGKDDDLLMAKAAAQAWYHRGTGSDKKPLSEYLSMGKIPGPSRNKISGKGANSKDLYNPSPSHSKSSLLDSYEIEMISRQLSRLIESSEKNSSNLIMYRNYKAQVHPDYQKSDTMNSNQKKKSSNGGIWSRYPVICGTLQDVVKQPTNYGVSGKVGSSRYQTRTRTGSMHSTRQSKGVPKATGNTSSS